MESHHVQALRDLANKLRIHSIIATNASNSGHPTSCASIAEIMSVLFFNTMKYKVTDPRNAANDRFVLSKGHAAPILYAAWAEAGLFPTSELLKLRKIESDLEGHPTPRLSFVDVATGSLGQGLSCAAGMAYTGKYFDKADYRVFCLIGDGESAEGSVWEALHFASHYKLDNLVAIFDVNRLGQSEATPLGHDTGAYQRRLEAFGCYAYVVDGHDVEALAKALHDASTVKGKPTCIVAKTIKGKGIQGIEDIGYWHGKALGVRAEAAVAAIKAQIVNLGSHGISPQIPDAVLSPPPTGPFKHETPTQYEIGQEVATREAFGVAVAKLGKSSPNLIVLESDIKKSTFSVKMQEAFPDRFVECFISEQNMVGVAIGCATRGRTIPFACTYSSFLSRAYDQLRMGAVSQTNANFVGSHCGVSVGAEGPSQMGLEDLAMFRAIPGSTIFYPSDAVSTERAVELAANTTGICYIRTSRPVVPVLYSNDETFAVGQAKVVRQSDNDQVTIIGAAITLREAFWAADALAESGIKVRIVDLFTIKPIDAETVFACAKATGGRVITVEDHYYEGGVGDAVASVLAGVGDIIHRHLAISGVPRSGTCHELLGLFRINADAIIRCVEELIVF